ncbi:LysR family transcriptional regulator [Amycolatopsis antarctica]|uniref:LysR family transcriptional regulator n=1 Tax=Amycolatopsis antarctica TaxID=1854586 RepID=A0A263D1C9_9PSEU|nr:LysR family transcriptional regulator [Amycolatopsis antarctica]OZM72253.1 LysR family transcriptional regulator [Amycolatopsis antarctica]
MTVELRHLRSFLAIAEERNVTRAAARLHVGQPALSRTLAQLERHLGVRLVDRSTRHLELTPAGLAFRERAAAAVTSVDRALDPVLLGRLPLRLGHAWAALGRDTVALQRSWEREHPDIPLRLLRIDERAAGLTTGEVDVALLRGAHPEHPGVRRETLTSEPRMAVLAADHALAERDELELADLRTQAIAMNTVAGSTELGLWPAESRPVRTVPVTNTDDWLAAIAAGHAVGVTSSATADIHPHPGVVYRPIVDAPPLPVLLAWTDPPGHPAVAELRALAHRTVHSGHPR